MKNKCNNRKLRWLLAAILLLGLGSASLYAQSIQVIAGTLDVIGEPDGGGFSGGLTTGQLLIPFADNSGSTAGLVWFSPGDGSGGYVHCAVASCTPSQITAFTQVLSYDGSQGDSSSGSFWNSLYAGVPTCMLGSGAVTKTTFQKKLDKSSGTLTVSGLATVSGTVLNYGNDPFGNCDQTNLIATYTISGTANYTAQFTPDPQSVNKAYTFQWMHISFNQ
jgi:hypothetical protein